MILIYWNGRWNIGKTNMRSLDKLFGSPSSENNYKFGKSQKMKKVKIEKVKIENW